MSTDQDVPLASHWCRVKGQPTPNKMTGAASSFIRSLKKEKTVLWRKEKKLRNSPSENYKIWDEKIKNQFVIPNTSFKYQFFF